MPAEFKARTACWVGLVFISPIKAGMGRYDTIINKTFSGSAKCIILAASKNNKFSYSPTVPPISIIIIPALVLRTAALMREITSLGISGTT